MKVHVLVEGKSEYALLTHWLPRFLPGHTFQVIYHRGRGRLSGTDQPSSTQSRRQGLLDQLPMKLRAFGRALDSQTDRVLVLVDADSTKCTELKERLVALTQSIDPAPVVLHRIAVEETEAFYLGDPKAIRAAFPTAKLTKLRGYEQDSICGTWERFAEVIGARSENKVAWAKAMGPHLSTDPAANESPSFRHLCGALLRLTGEPTPRSPPRRTKPNHPSPRRAKTKRRGR
ncbi:MAG: DUF4276 family protein [Nannocystaceae bacterium]